MNAFWSKLLTNKNTQNFLATAASELLGYGAAKAQDKINGTKNAAWTTYRNNIENAAMGAAEQEVQDRIQVNQAQATVTEPQN